MTSRETPRRWTLSSNRISGPSFRMGELVEVMPVSEHLAALKEMEADRDEAYVTARRSDDRVARLITRSLSEEERDAVLKAIDAEEMYAHFTPGLITVLRSAREKLT